MMRIGVMFALAMLGSITFAFRHFVSSGFDMIAGNAGDPRIMMAVLEHWRAVITGFDRIDSLPVFHPVTNTLSHTDTHLLHATPYVLFRIFADEHLAYELTLMCASGVGFLSMALLLRDGLKLPLWTALLGAVLFTVLLVRYQLMEFGQLFIVGYVPLVFWSAIVWLRRSLQFAGSALAVLFVLIAFSSFQIVWFAALYLTLLSLAVVVWQLLSRDFRNDAERVRSALLGRTRDLALATIAVTVLGALFVMLYLPRLKEHGGIALEEILKGSKDIRAAISVGPGGGLAVGYIHKQ